MIFSPHTGKAKNTTLLELPSFFVEHHGTLSPYIPARQISPPLTHGHTQRQSCKGLGWALWNCFMAGYTARNQRNSDS